MNTLLLQIQSPENSNQEAISNYYYFILYGLLFLVFWYFFIRKPIHDQKKEQQLIEELLKKGDKVITKGGIHGKIIEVSDNTVVIENQGSKLKIEKSAIGVNLVSDQLS